MYVARLSYSAQAVEVEFSAEFEANPADLTNFDNFMECASHYANAWIAEFPDAISSVSLNAETSEVTFYYVDGEPLVVTVVTRPGELLDIIPDA